MSVIVDTGVFFAQHDEGATRHESATTAMNAVVTGQFGKPYTSDYVFDETVTLTQKRSGRHDAAWTVGQRILGRNEFRRIVELLQITSELFEDAIETFERYDDQSLSFTDASTIALVERYDIDAVLSFDDDFDGIVDRIDPASV